MRSFITGVDGFIGSHLAEALLASGDEVFGLSRASVGSTGAGGGVVRFQVDLAAPDGLAAALAQARPDRIFHLAALNNIQASFADPGLTVRTNVLGTLALLDAVRLVAPAAAFVSVGSSAEYGRTAALARAPLTEDLPLQPTSPYGISKASQGMFSTVYAKVHGLRAIHVRPFAVIGPRKTKDALSDFCRTVVAIERGETDRFPVGPLDSQRDFVDVRDCVRALVLVADKGEPGTTYNVCNGTGTTLAAVVALLQGLARRPFEPAPDPSRTRAADDPRIVGDNARLRVLGYQPRFSLAETTAATLDYWRAATGGPPG
jgi:GDP-4-dehydro-6-deoxy-D-mannose reductase